MIDANYNNVRHSVIGQNNFLGVNKILVCGNDAQDSRYNIQKAGEVEEGGINEYSLAKKYSLPVDNSNIQKKNYK